MSRLLGQQVSSREIFEGHDGRSGAIIERAVLANGQRVIVKTADPAADLVMAVSGDEQGRELTLWRSGVFGRLPSGIANPVLDGWRDPDGRIVLVMRDLGPSVLGWHDRLSRADCARVVGTMTAIHRTFEGAELPGLCSLDRYLVGLSPAVIAEHRDKPSPLPALIIEGWDRFADLVPAEIWAWVQSVFADPAEFAGQLVKGGTTLVHGDLWPANIALESNQVALLDWGFAVAAPGPVELGAFVSGIAGIVDVSLDELVEMYRAAWVCPAELVDSGVVTGLLQYGWNVALGATSDDPQERGRLRAELEWWIAKVRATQVT